MRTKGMKVFEQHNLLYAAAIGLTMPVAPAAAQEKTAAADEEPGTGSDAGSRSEIIVTATRRAESVQRVPQSITALSDQELQKRGADTIEDYTRAVPGLMYSKGGANSGTFQIRGISTSTNVSNTQAPVALYYDDLPSLSSYSPRVTSDLRLFDIERVEVLRGPQGTLFGSGSLSGAIRVITKKPDPTEVQAAAESTLSSTKGGGESYALNGMVNIPLVKDELALRIVGYYRSDAGWVDHPNYAGRNDNGGESYGGRAMLRYNGDRLTLTGYVGYQKDDSGDRDYSYYSGVPKDEFGNFAPQNASQRNWTFNLTGEYDLDVATLTSVTTYQDQRTSYATDFTTVTRRIYGVQAPAPDISTGHSKIFAQELRVTSSGTGPLQYVFGGFYSRNDDEGNERLLVPGAGVVLAPRGFPSDLLYDGATRIKTSEAAVFGEVTYELLPRLKATAGLRVFRNTFNLSTAASGIFNGGTTSNTRRNVYSSATPKFVLSYQATADIMVYAQAARGYRVGAAAVAPPVDPVSGEAIPQFYDPDHLWNYELGLKSSFFDRKLIFNLAAYRINWSDIQLQLTSPGGLTYLTNAGKAHSQGIEAEIQFRPTPAIELSSGLAFNRSRIDEIAAGGAAKVGDRLPGAPRFSASNSARFNVPLGATLKGYLNIDHVYSGRAYSSLKNFQNPAALEIGDYNLFNARMGLTSGGLEGVLFVNNLTNSRGKVGAVALPIAAAAARLRPRTIGATIRYRF